MVNNTFHVHQNMAAYFQLPVLKSAIFPQTPLDWTTMKKSNYVKQSKIINRRYKKKTLSYTHRNLETYKHTQHATRIYILYIKYNYTYM